MTDVPYTGLVVACTAIVVLGIFLPQIFPQKPPGQTFTGEEHVRARDKRDFILYGRSSHKPKLLSAASLQQIADLSDHDYFKTSLLGPMLRVRVPDTEGNTQVQEHIRSFMKSFAWHIQEDPFTDETPLGTKKFNNIIATQNPDASRTLTLACHFDSKYFEHFEFIGATDSAVPCAMMLDVARSLNTSLWTSEKLHDLSLQFIFFDGEEAFVHWTDRDSIYGARHWAKKLAETDKRVMRDLVVKEIETIDALVLLDLIGTKTVKFNSFFSNTHDLFKRLQKLEEKMGKADLLDLPSKFNKNNYFVGKLRSGSGIEDDHIPFLHRGVPVLHLISSPFPREWHTVHDDESCLHYPTIHNLNHVLRAFVAEYLHLTI